MGRTDRRRSPPMSVRRRLRAGAHVVRCQRTRGADPHSLADEVPIKRRVVVWRSDGCQPAGGARDSNGARPDAGKPKAAEAFAWLTSPNLMTAAGCSVSGTNEVATREAEKQIGHRSSSSARLKGARLERARFARFDTAASATVALLQPSTTREPVAAESCGCTCPKDAAICRTRASSASLAPVRRATLRNDGKQVRCKSPPSVKWSPPSSAIVPPTIPSLEQVFGRSCHLHVRHAQRQSRFRQRRSASLTGAVIVTL
jgi:hypothetical protein